MSKMLDHAKCEQCGYELGDYEFNCHTSEWEFGCRRCGYCEFLEWITDDEGN